VMPAAAPNALQIASDLTLPLEAVTQTFGILGKRGGGKSYTAKVLAEEMLGANAHVCAVDPIGNWWGLRLAASGKSPGLPITVLGGDYGDLPLQATEKAGEEIARFLVEEKISVVIDLSRFRKGEQTQFMIGFAESLYRLNREALHLFIDEADAWAPQRPVGNLAPRLLGAMEDLVRRGRARGIGVTMITQRSASINKDLLTQIEVLIAKRTIAPQDRAAIEAWVKVHGTPEKQALMMNSLASLAVEKAWFWSPAWLDLFQCVKVRKLETFDSSATPEVGGTRAAPRKLAAVDLARLEQRLAETIEKAKAEDPRELRRKLADAQKEAARLKAELERRPQTPIEKIIEKPVEVQVVSEEALARLETIGREILHAVANARSAAAYQRASQRPERSTGTPIKPGPARPAAPAPSRTRNIRVGNSSEGTAELPAGERKILAAVAQHGQVTKPQLTVLTGYKRSSRDTYLQRLAAKGFVDLSADPRPTEEGIAALGDFEPLPTGSELLAHWLDRLPAGEKRILEILADAQGELVDRDTIGELSEYQRSSRDTYIQRLAARQLVIAEKGGVRAAPELFG